MKKINNTYCPGNRAKVKVESFKYKSQTQMGTSVYVDYFWNWEQFKRLWSHNNYMDAEKIYVKVGRSWVETENVK